MAACPGAAACLGVAAPLRGHGLLQSHGLLGAGRIRVTARAGLPSGFAAAGLAGVAVFAAGCGRAAALAAGSATAALPFVTAVFATAVAERFGTVPAEARAAGRPGTPEVGVTALRSLVADAFMANLVAPGRSMIGRSAVDGTQIAAQPSDPGRRRNAAELPYVEEAEPNRATLAAASALSVWSFTPTNTSYRIWASRYRGARTCNPLTAHNSRISGAQRPAHRWHRAPARAHAPPQGTPGSGENSLPLSGLSFHSSASAGGSPLRVMFGHSAE